MSQALKIVPLVLLLALLPLPAADGGGRAGVSLVSAGSPPPVRKAVTRAASRSQQLKFVGVTYAGRRQGGREFSAERLMDLLIVVNWKRLSGTHTQRLELFAPDGALYQRMSAQHAFSGKQDRVETRLPVGGTWITEYSLYGAWRVEVYLDQERTPILSEVFVLTP